MKTYTEFKNGLSEGGKFGIYRKSQKQQDGNDGHTSALSAMVKKSGKHVTFKNKAQADSWIKANSKGESLFARKISKAVK